MRSSMSPCSESIPQIRLMCWIGVSLLLMWMELRGGIDTYHGYPGASLVNQDYEASEGVMAAP